jgi:hypothetical protein
MKNGNAKDLGAALKSLLPIKHALLDPHFTLVPRPIDSAWKYAGFTGAMGGFNPSCNAHFFASESAIARWLQDTDARFETPEEQEQLVREVLYMAHDYLHSWAYRAIAHIQPSLAAEPAITRENLEIQAFLLVLTETVAVIGLDYWYLCVKSVGKRCGAPIDLGPCTVHYKEQLINEYRRFNAKLDVQHPDFFGDIARLYSYGAMAGFSERDLLESRPLASWLIRELLIAPRQREVARLWLSRLGGFEIEDDKLRDPFTIAGNHVDNLIHELSHLLWNKIKKGNQLFYEPQPDVLPWRHNADADIDFRFINLNRLGERKVRWRSSIHGVTSWNFYIDQILAGHYLPESAESRQALRQEVARIKENFDAKRLERLVGELSPVQNRRLDASPLELLFVN